VVFVWVSDDSDVVVSEEAEAVWLPLVDGTEPMAAWGLGLLSAASPSGVPIGIESENVTRVITSIKPSAMRTSPVDLAILAVYRENDRGKDRADYVDCRTEPGQQVSKFLGLGGSDQH